jgi:hypothetical protein
LQKPPIHLEGGEGGEQTAMANGKNESFHLIIPPPDRQTIIKLGLFAAVLSLAASLPLNFVPKYPFY